MFCSIYKWFISQALESRKPVTNLVRRHLRSCASCREFAVFSDSLGERSAQDISEILKGYDDTLDKQILLKLSKSPEQEESPAPRVGPVEIFNETNLRRLIQRGVRPSDSAVERKWSFPMNS